MKLHQLNNDEPSPIDLPQLPHYRHVLRTSHGVTITASLNEATGACDLEWSECPTVELLEVIEGEYYPWRDEILRAWEKRTGRHYFAYE